MKSSFLEYLSRHILVVDGAMGTNLQLRNLTADDFGGQALEGCNEYLVISNPGVVEEIHREFLDAGADIIETNTFGATSVVLAEYNISRLAYELNLKAARIGKKAAEEYSVPDQPRFVAGSVGPTTKLPSLGHIGFDVLRKSYHEQISGLIDGGVDLLSIETCQDMLQMKAALVAAMDCFQEKGIQLPVIAAVTIETSGTMLLGTEIGAALTTIDPYDIVSVFGINCATGPKEMEEPLRYLCANSSRPVIVMPNAGLPETIAGQVCYTLSPEEMAMWMESFVAELGVNIIGGCCGTAPEHIRRFAAIASRYQPKTRVTESAPAVSSLYSSVPLHLDPPPLIIGERCNANGSKKFRDLLLADDFDGIVGMAKEQVREGSHILDVCVSYVIRDEKRDMTEIIRRFNTQVSVPLMIDSTDAAVIEEALKLYGGKAIVNSVNLEDGGGRMEEILALCEKYGAAVVALTIDEDGMAKTAKKKLEVASRMRDIAVKKHGMQERDLIFDPLTFTLASGDEEYRKSALETLESIRLIKANYPDSHISLGISNVSFGLSPRARHVLNSVFLSCAVEAGLDLAIVQASRILPLYKIDERGKALAMDVIFDRRRYE